MCSDEAGAMPAGMWFSEVVAVADSGCGTPLCSTLDCEDKFSTALKPLFHRSAPLPWRVTIGCLLIMPLIWKVPHIPKRTCAALLSSCRHLEAGSHLHLHSPSELTECFPEGLLEFAACSEEIQGSSSKIIYLLSKLCPYNSWHWFELVHSHDKGVTLPGSAAIIDNNTD